ncbi:MAG: PQQ-binding-like beta-propeller repeat protein [Vicinamibacterales bacterium]
MRSGTRISGVVAGSAILFVMTVAHAQGPGRTNANWPTVGADAQRTSWMKNEIKLSAASMAQPGFRLLWTSKLENQPAQLNALTQPLLLQNIISHKGFKALAFVGGSADVVYAIDYDLNRVYWKQRLSTATRARNATALCPGGLTSITRATTVTPPGLPGARGGPGGGPGGGGPVGGGGPGGRGPAPGGGQAPALNPRGLNMNNLPINNAVYAISGGGMLHFLNPHTGTDIQPPVRFLPANAKAIGLISIDSVLYVATSDGCGGAPNGMWAMDLGSEAKTISSWQSDSGTVVGVTGPTFGFDGTIYVAAGTSVAVLEPKTLKRRTEARFPAALTTAPVAFQFKDRDFLAVGNSDGRVHLLESKSGGLVPAGRSPEYGAATESRQALATWDDPSGTRWVLAPSSTGVVAFKLVESNGSFALEPGWRSLEFSSPVVSTILNDIVFSLVSGLPSADSKTPVNDRLRGATGAVLVALDARTGKELWTSGKTITSFSPGIAPSAGDSQVYVVTHDGTLYAFGLPQER